MASAVTTSSGRRLLAGDRPTHDERKAPLHRDPETAQQAFAQKAAPTQAADLILVDVEDVAAPGIGKRRQVAAIEAARRPGAEGHRRAAHAARSPAAQIERDSEADESAGDEDVARVHGAPSNDDRRDAKRGQGQNVSV